MNKKMKRALLGLVCTVLVFAVVPAFAAQAEKVFVAKDQEWQMKIKDKLTDAPAPNGCQEIGGVWYYWLFVDPETQDESKGMKRGILFYVEKTKKYTFLPLEKGDVNAVHFSPDGAMFIVEGPGESEINNIALELYGFADLKSKLKTVKAAIPPQWVDAGRFVYSRFESGTSRGRPDGYPNEWVSLALYDTIAGEETVLKAATKTSDYNFMGIKEGGEVLVLEEYVDSPKDWADPDKPKSRELSVPLPAAG